MPPVQIKTLLPPLLTFAVGLGTGALVFSDPSAPESAPPPSFSEAVTPAPHPVAAAVGVRPVATPAPLPTPAPPDDKLAAQVATLMDGWGRVQGELADLRARVAVLEQQSGPAPTTSDAAPPADPAEQQREALLRAGVPPAQAADLLDRRANVALQRLELRDQAIREGWLGSDRYREALAALDEQQVSLRDELDPAIYDRYLFESGEDNRVRVTGVIPNSVAATTGLLPGDLVERYADQPIFDYRELRQATSAGERGELVTVQVRRGGETLDLVLPRGPIGVQLDGVRVQP